MTGLVSALRRLSRPTANAVFFVVWGGSTAAFAVLLFAIGFVLAAASFPEPGWLLLEPRP